MHGGFVLVQILCTNSVARRVIYIIFAPTNTHTMALGKALWIKIDQSQKRAVIRKTQSYLTFPEVLFLNT